MQPSLLMVFLAASVIQSRYLLVELEADGSEGGSFGGMEGRDSKGGSFEGMEENGSEGSSFGGIQTSTC